MATIYLVRHGQASAFSENYDQLSSLGEMQSSIVGEYLNASSFKAHTIVSGTMKRHQQTANAALEQMSQKVDVQQIAALNEFDHQDALATFDSRFSTTGGLLKLAKAQTDPRQFFVDNFNQAIRRWTCGEFDEEYKESWSSFVTRTQAGMSALINIVQSAPKSGSTLVFTSGGVISMWCCHALGIPQENFLTINHNLVNAGITKFVVDKQGRIKLSTLNQHHYFEHNPKELITYT